MQLVLTTLFNVLQKNQINLVTLKLKTDGNSLWIGLAFNEDLAKLQQLV